MMNLKLVNIYLELEVNNKPRVLAHWTVNSI